MSAAPQKIRTGLVELRTKLGPVYVNPSFWERVHLLWTFRNFRTLPRQVLNEREQRLIDNLCRTAVVRRAVPTTAAPIIGIVENVELISVSNVETSAPPRKLVNMSVTDVGVIASRAVGGMSVPFNWAARAGNVAERFRSRSKVLPISEPRVDCEEQRPTKKHSRLRSIVGEFGYWGGWAAIGLCGLAVVAIRLDLQRNQPATSEAVVRAMSAVHTATPEIAPISLNSIHPTVAVTTKIQQPLSQQQQLTNAVFPAGNALTPIQTTHKSTKTAITRPLAMVKTEISAEQRSQRLRIAEAPAKWSYPVAPDSSLTGNVILKAVVGKDGNVNEVDVLSGKRALAQAAKQAVRHWKYRTHEIDGTAVEAETKIDIKFLGDAISISYPAN